MPLDKHRGEVLKGWEGKPFFVIPHTIIADMTNFQVTFKRPKASFGTEIVRTQIFDHAAAEANKAFATKGLILVSPFDESAVSVQVYPKHRQIVFIFAKQVAGQEHFVPLTYDVPPPILNEIANHARKHYGLH